MKSVCVQNENKWSILKLFLYGLIFISSVKIFFSQCPTNRDKSRDLDCKIDN